MPRFSCLQRASKTRPKSLADSESALKYGVHTLSRNFLFDFENGRLMPRSPAPALLR